MNLLRARSRAWYPFPVQTGEAHGRAAWRHVAQALALGLAGVLLGSAVIASRQSAAEGYWAVGYYRLLADALWQRFDGALPVAIPVALAAGALVAVLRRGRKGPRLGPALALLALVGGLRGASALDAWLASRGPNLVIISIDTLRADRLGAYGYALPTSPTLDRLAAEGVLVEDVYSQSPKTTPSHMTLLTSLYPCVHGVELWWHDEPAHVLSPAVHTLAEVLKNAGYATVAFTGGGQVDRSRGFDQGFDRYSHGQELEKTLRWLDAHRRGKFFLFFHTYLVHDPYVHPLRWVHLFDAHYRGAVLDTVERLLTEEDGRGGPEAYSQDRHRRFWASVQQDDPADIEFVARLYDAGIRRMDETVLAPLLGRLDALGLARDTLVVFTSDHGEAFAEHGHFGHDDLHAETLRVPLVLRFPGRLIAGRRVAGRARILDVMPTVLDLLGVPAPPVVQGRSLVPWLMGHPDPAGADDAVSEYDHRWAGRVYESVRRGRLSYIVEDAHEHLFDLSDDPGEANDLLDTRPTDAAALRAALASWLEECRGLAGRFGPGDAIVRPSAERARQLRALGYVE